MRNVSHKSRISLLLEYVDQWRNSMDWSRETVCEQIVEAHYRIGADRLTQVKFDRAGDLVTIQKNNADRIYRWLDDKSKDRNLLNTNFEQSILAALPANILRAYMNDVLSSLGLEVNGIDECKEGKINAASLLVNITRETSEAQVAVANLIDGPTKENLKTADRELGEAEEAIRSAHAVVRAQIH